MNSGPWIEKEDVKDQVEWSSPSAVISFLKVDIFYITLQAKTNKV